MSMFGEGIALGRCLYLAIGLLLGFLMGLGVHP